MNRVRTISRWLALAMLAVAMWPTAVWAAGPPVAKPLNSISFSDATHGYVSGGDGANGVVSWTSDGGATWHAKIEPGRYLVGVSATTGGATAVPNFFDGIFRSTDAGVTWTAESPLLNRDFTLAGMAYLSGNRRVIVGKFTAANPEALLASSVGNASPWTIDLEGPSYPPPDPNTDPPLTYAELTSIDATSAGLVAWAVGNNGTLRTGTQPPFDPLIYRTVDGGSSWTTRTVAPGTTTPGITSVAAADVNHAFIAEKTARLLRTRDGGTTWETIAVQGLGTSAVNALDALNADQVVVVGDGGRIAYTANASADAPTWTTKTAIATGTGALLGVHMIDAFNWIVVGANETILRTNNAGATWTGPTAPGAPTVAITSPTGPNLLSSAYISGTSNDGQGIGVAKVELTIVRGDGKYWNGSAWAAPATWVLVPNPTNNLDNWTFPIPDTTGAGALTVTARATDGLGAPGPGAMITSIAQNIKPVYRFRNLKNGYYLWSADESEKNTIVATLYKTWLLEGVAYQINVANPLNTDPLWRFVNIKGGFYLYSSDPNEKAGIQANLAKVWRYEGPAYNVSRTSGSPVWRFRNIKNGTYLYSADPAEKDSIVANLSKVWQLEGIAYFIAP